MLQVKIPDFDIKVSFGGDSSEFVSWFRECKSKFRGSLIEPERYLEVHSPVTMKIVGTGFTILSEVRDKI